MVILLYAIIASIVCAAIALGVMLHLGGRRHSRFLHKSNATVERSFTSDSRPILTVAHTHGFPTFRLEFPSQNAHKAAIESGSLDRFIVELELICHWKGTKDNPFDLKKALYCTDPEKERAYSEWIADERRKFEARIREQNGGA